MLCVIIYPYRHSFDSFVSKECETVKAKEKDLLKGFLFMLIVFSALTESAFAHIPCQCDNLPDQCTCFIQLGDKGYAVKKIIIVLQSKGYLGKVNRNSEFTPEVRQAVLSFQTDHGLECTGWMDDETLDALLEDILPDMRAKNKKEIWDSRFWDTICYIPTDGGEKHHATPFCSDMLNPRLMSRQNAMSLGILPCGKKTCKQSYLTYSSLGLKPRILPDEYYEEENADLTLIAEGLDDSSINRSLPDDGIDSVYIGNRNSHIFHSASCNSVKDMSEKNKIEFQSRDEAIEKGYKPCSRCNP